MGKKSFRETLWFKKGDLDAQEVPAPASDDEPSSNALLPIEDRYLDDGSVTGSDRVAFSIQTGSTQHLQPIEDEGIDVGTGAELDSLVGEMKRGRRRVYAALGASVATASVVALLYMM